MKEQRAEREEKKGAGPRAPTDQSRIPCWRSKSKAWWALAWQLGSFVFFCSGIAAQTQTRAAGTTPTVSLGVYNYAPVSDSVLRSAKEQAAKAFLQAGIETDWRDCLLEPKDSPNPCGFSGASGSAHLVIKILPSCMTERMAADRSSLGFAALGAKSQRGSDAFVFFDRVERVTGLRYVSEAQLLATVMAHEIGHLLLGPGHSRAGIMGGLVDDEANSLRLARFGVPEFMPDQAQCLRAELTRALTETALVSGTGSTTHAEVPFKLYGDYTIVVRGSIGDRHKLNFLIDTGSSSTVVDGPLARKLRLAKSSRKIAVFASLVTTEEVVLPSLQLGPLHAISLPAVVRDLSYFQDSLSAHVDVIVGIDVLSRTSFTIDYEARKLILGPVERLSNSVPCDPRSPYPTVALRLGNRVVRVLVDTGTQELALFEKPPGGLLPDGQRVEEETRTSMAGQVVIKRAEFHELALGAAHWARREALFVEAPPTLFDGLLGPRWLGTKRIGFDFEHKLISWEK